MSHAKLTQTELDKLLEEAWEDLQTASRSLVTGEVYAEDILIIRIMGSTVGMADNSSTIVKITDLIKGVDQHVMIDLSDCPFFSSFAVGALVKLVKRLEANNKRLVIFGPNENVMSIFKITGLDRYMAIADTQEASLKLLKTPA